MGDVFNLVMTECTTNILPAEDLFGLVEQSSIFLSNSHKRISIWTLLDIEIRHIINFKDYNKLALHDGRVKTKNNH